MFSLLKCPKCGSFAVGSLDNKYEVVVKVQLVGSRGVVLHWFELTGCLCRNCSNILSTDITSMKRLECELKERMETFFPNSAYYITSVQVR